MTSWCERLVFLLLCCSGGGILGLERLEVQDPPGEECFQGAHCNHGVKAPKGGTWFVMGTGFKTVTDGSSFCRAFLWRCSL